MWDEIKQICDATIENYRYSREKLRFDGYYINHFSALINGCSKKDIPVDRVKKVRTYVKDNTSKISPFRGDMLYIVSFLIVFNGSDDLFGFIDEMIETFDELVENGFKECEHLVLSAYAITRYKSKDERKLIIKKMKYIFCMIKSTYGNLTKEDDYLLCSLLAIICSDFDSMTEYMESVFEYMSELRLFSKNGVQGLTNSILLNNDKDIPNKISRFLIELEKSGMKIGYQFLQVLGVLVSQDVNEDIKIMKKVLEYLCEEEMEYSFYIDKDFRNMIVLVISLYGSGNKDVKYLNELIAFGTYSFLSSKNQGRINEVLA